MTRSNPPAVRQSLEVEYVCYPVLHVVHGDLDHFNLHVYSAMHRDPTH